MDAHELLETMRALELEIGHYVVSGSGPLAVRGIREANDLDIQVDDPLWHELEARFGPAGDGKTLALSDRVDAHRVSDDALEDVPTFGEQVRMADVIEGIAFVNLEHTKALKRAKRRPKDMEDIRLVERWQKAQGDVTRDGVTLRAFEAFARAQGAMYRGGDRDAVRERLTPEVIWHVPGDNAIAGDHRGRDAVMAYFDRRRALAGGAMTILPSERLIRDDTVVQFADGQLERDGERLRWRTVGVYRFDGERVAEAWLVPLESAAFDHIWTG
jgi:uncharacterized protein